MLIAKIFQHSFSFYESTFNHMIFIEIRQRPLAVVPCKIRIRSLNNVRALKFLLKKHKKQYNHFHSDHEIARGRVL